MFLIKLNRIQYPFFVALHQFFLSPNQGFTHNLPTKKPLRYRWTCNNFPPNKNQEDNDTSTQRYSIQTRMFSEQSVE
ncbi:unnamed protein product [Sphenostylis stenocarpa]|uniref:Uncharacterized protein n=1 Tax=Sphenostylis stenocarpa TaxID=92480 RepID=A0AA86V7W9_9FABA|nr:unnamed protein product [Sphenostylis stenocarpa]